MHINIFKCLLSGSGSENGHQNQTQRCESYKHIIIHSSFIQFNNHKNAINFICWGWDWSDRPNAMPQSTAMSWIEWNGIHYPILIILNSVMVVSGLSEEVRRTWFEVPMGHNKLLIILYVFIVIMFVTAILWDEGEVNGFAFVAIWWNVRIDILLFCNRD